MPSTKPPINANGTDIRRGSTHHSLLMYAKMIRRPFTVREVCFLAKLGAPKRVNAAAKKLIEKGYLIKTSKDPTYQVTPLGITMVYRVAKHGSRPDTED